MPGRLGNAHPNIAPYQIFATADGYIIIAVGNDRQFNEFCRIAGARQLTRTCASRRTQARVENRWEFTALLSHRSKRARHDWVAALEAAGVPNGPINTIEQVFEEPQVARGRSRSGFHPRWRRDAVVASPMRFSETPLEYKKAPPTLGDATDEVLSGYPLLGAEEIGKLRKANTIG